MIKVGTDIIEIERIKSACESENFKNKIFTKTELDYYISGGSRAETLAGMFAAKEAAGKALGCGVKGFKHTDIEVDHTELKAPFYKFYNNAAKLFENFEAALSISHCEAYATAVCVLEKKKDVFRKC